MPASKRCFIYPLIAAISVMTATTSLYAGVENKEVPRLVVNILVEQLRTDYIKAFMPLYGEDGFRALFKHGLVYSQAEMPMTHPDKASAAATIATGTTPSNHGIIALQWLDRKKLAPVGCVEDNRYLGVNTAQTVSPKYLSVSTIGDELKIATSGKAYVYSIAPSASTAILNAGHAADGAYWFDNVQGNWCTSSYYVAQLPEWVNLCNRQLASLAPDLDVWQPVSEVVGHFNYFLSRDVAKPFLHKFKGVRKYQDFKTSGLINQEVERLANYCVNRTPIGEDYIPDYLSVTFYAGNYRHQAFMNNQMEAQDTYVRLDKAIAALIHSVENKVGLDKTLFVLTSTGQEDEESFIDLSKYKVPTGVFDVKRAAALLNMYLVAVYGHGQYVESSFATQLYLNHKLIEQKQLNLSEVLDRVQDFLLQLDGVKDVYTSRRLLQGAWTPGINRIRNGYNPRFSGDVMIDVMPGWRYVNSDTHENHLVRSSFIPFPIIFYGYGLPEKKVLRPVTADYIAPTISAALRIRAPNACNVQPLDEVQ